MATEISMDLFYVDLEQRDDVKRLASLGYRPVEIAVSLGLDQQKTAAFIRDADTPGTTVSTLIREGLLVTKAAPEVKLHEAAEAGNVDAIKELNIVNFRHAYARTLEEMDEDEYKGYE